MSSCLLEVTNKIYIEKNGKYNFANKTLPMFTIRCTFKINDLYNILISHYY